MARSAIDATRFTSTTPHASAKPPASSIPSNRAPKLPSRFPGPPGETPQQKVKRLRAAADASRNAQITTMDRMILRGRVWADKLHKFTALTLIGCTFIAGGVTVYALGDMILYNRRKKHEWMLDQKAQFKHALESAHTALSTGTATEEQLAFLQREEEHVLQVRQAEAAKKKPGIFKKSKEWLFSGLKKEEEGDDVGSSERRLGYEALSEEDDAMGERESDILRAIEERRLELKEKAKNAFEVEKERQRTGGMLDRLGTKNESLSTSKEEEPKARGWTSFMTRR